MHVLRVRPAVAAGVFLGIASSAAFTYFAARHVDWRQFRNGLQACDVRWLGLAAVTLGIGILIRALRWQLLFPASSRPPFAPTLRALLVGTFLNNVFPGRPGEAVRVLTLHHEVGTPRATAAGTVLSERITDVATLLALLFIALPWLPRYEWMGRAMIVGGCATFGLAVFVAVLLRWRRRPLTRRWRSLSGVVDGLAALYDPRIAVPTLALSFISTLVITLSKWFVALAFSLHIGFSGALLIMIVTNLSMVIPSSPAAIGVFEAATLFALSRYNVDHSAALSYAVVLHALNTLPFVAIGAVLMTRGALRAATISGARGVLLRTLPRTTPAAAGAP